MKIEKTKQERDLEVSESYKIKYDEIVAKVCKFGKVEVTFDRDDFKDKLSTNFGWGFQDMKKEYQLLVTDLLANGYKVKFEAISSNVVGVRLKVSKKV